MWKRGQSTACQKHLPSAGPHGHHQHEARSWTCEVWAQCLAMCLYVSRYTYEG